VRIREVEQSLSLVEQIIRHLQDGPIAVPTLVEKKDAES
jgi:hypothetical protein